MTNTNFNAVQAVVSRLELVVKDSFMLVETASSLGLLPHPFVLSDVSYNGAGVFVASTSPAFNMSNKFAQSIQNEDAFKSVFALNATVIRSHVLAVLSLGSAVRGEKNTVSMIDVQDVYVEPNHQNAETYIRSNFIDIIETARALSSSLLIPFGYAQTLYNSELTFEGPAARNIVKIDKALDSLASVNVFIADMIDDMSGAGTISSLRAPLVRSPEPECNTDTLVGASDSPCAGDTGGSEDSCESDEGMYEGMLSRMADVPISTFNSMKSAEEFISCLTRAEALAFLEKLHSANMTRYAAGSKLSTKQIKTYIAKTLACLI